MATFPEGLKCLCYEVYCLTRVLHDIETKLLHALEDLQDADYDILCKKTGLLPDQVRRGVEWLRHKGLVSISHKERALVSLGTSGMRAYSDGLPERRLADLAASGICDMAKLASILGDDLKPALGMARKNGWVRISGSVVTANPASGTSPAEVLVRRVGSGTVEAASLNSDALQSLARRPDYIRLQTSRSSSISLTTEGKRVDLDGLPAGAIDVEAPAPVAYPAKSHPLRDVINEIREVFALLGFAEITGSMAQSSFWNFDALFTPQDHPAREMQDTFFLEGMNAADTASKDTIERVARTHQGVWDRPWSRAESERMVLRTHTTCVTIRYLAENNPDDARIFSLGRVFRNEKVSYRHLAEFHQIEGVVTGKNSTLRDLMGIQKEFYRRIGLDRVKFWPTFFPYTEPSLQSMVYSEQLGKWIELFGMGIFRPQVTGPLGIDGPVLAWGGGIERIAMLMYGLDDVREFYNSNVRWLRGASRCR